MSTDTAWRAGRFDGKSAGQRVLFGRMYEDAAIELAAFVGARRVFCIASAGCTALTLSADHEVVACDINRAQLAYTERRIAGAALANGSAERIMSALRAVAPIAGWTRKAITRFLALDEGTAQLDYWHRVLDTRRFRAGLAAALSMTGLRAWYAPRLLAVLPAQFARVLRTRMERAFSLHPNQVNPYAALLLTGETQTPPSRATATNIELVLSDAATYLASCAPGSFDGVSLSNILDGASPDYAKRLFAAVRHASSAHAVVVRRSFAEPGEDAAYNQAARDRSMLWGVVDVRPASALPR